MAVFKIVGKIAKVLEGGQVKEYVTKTYVRAVDAVQASGIGEVLGFKEMEVSYFGNNCTSLGDNTHYAADNGLGVLPGM